MEKVGIKLLITLFVIIACLSGIILGTRIEQKRVEAEAQLDTISEIAVVNLDEGIRQDNKQAYYSNDLLEYPSDNFVMTNLESAKLGINNGSFAAYVVIPADFTSKAVSINSEPKKVILEYALNQNLRQDFAVLAIADIKNFEMQINTNMSYMYMQAILDEFHDVQDSADTIMENDITDMENLVAINADDLIEELEFTELEQIDSELQEVDIDEEMDANAEYAKQLRDNYDEFVTKGMEEFETIKEDEEAVAALIDEFSLAMSEIDIMSDEDGKLIYEEGIADIGLYVDEYEAEYADYVGAIMKKLGVETPTPTIAPTPTTIPTPTVTPTVTPTPTITPTQTIMPTIAPTASTISIRNNEPAMTQTIKRENCVVRKNYRDIYINEDAADVLNVSINLKSAVQIQNSEGTIILLTEATPQPTQEPEITVQPTQEPEATPQPTQEPETTIQPTQEPEATIQPTQEPEATIQPTQIPDMITPYVIMREGEVPTATPTSTPTSTPAITPEPTNDELLSAQIKKAVEAELQKQLEEYNNNLNAKIAMLRTEIAGLPLEQQEILGQAVDDIYSVDVESLLNNIDIEALTEEIFKDLITEIQNAPTLDLEEVRLMIEEGISTPIQEKVDKEATKIMEDAEIVNKGMEDYITKQAEFDPYDYLDQEVIDTLLADFEDNAYLMEDEVNQFYYDNLDYTDEVISTTDNNMLILQGDLEASYAGTKENVTEAVDTAKENRKSINELNISMLNDFTEKLPYTRIGELEYIQAYDFMVKPVVSVDTGNGKVSMIIAESDYEILKWITGILLGIWIVGAFCLLAHRLKQEKNDEL